MVWYVKEKPTQQELKDLFNSMKAGKKGVNVKKYAGKVKAKGNPLALQKKLRDEWN
jgi:hypothetical protein